VDNDEYFYVKNIARPGETISSYRYERRVGGKGANQAIAIIKAGGTADFYGSVGQDGLWVKDTVATFGLDPSGISISDVCPTLADLIGENSIILFPGANCSQLPEETWETSGVAFPECTHVLLQNEIHMECTLYALNNSV
ncbi:Ribokinase, partial [Termitomyces sp. T112]